MNANSVADPGSNEPYSDLPEHIDRLPFSFLLQCISSWTGCFLTSRSP
jgi:hypothetical protein